MVNCISISIVFFFLKRSFNRFCITHRAFLNFGAMINKDTKKDWTKRLSWDWSWKFSSGFYGGKTMANESPYVPFHKDLK